MVRKLGRSLLHVPDAVLNGEAKLVGRLPATQTIHFDIVLALRHQRS
jgi:hypothetical protein